jgi:hypothetical protein
MEVYADFRQKVQIDPIDVINELIDKAKGGWRNYIFEENGKYYLGWEESCGAHSSDEQEEITKELYDYYRALQAVLAYLKNQKKVR